LHRHDWGGRTRAGRALVVKRAVFEKGELRTVVGELVDLTVIELVRADQLRRGEQPPAAITDAAVGGERGMFREPTRDRRGGDAVAIARREFFCGRFKRVAAVVAMSAGRLKCSVSLDPPGVPGLPSRMTNLPSRVNL
jgi:hypothetical protein